MPSREDLWKQYQINVDLYKHYLKLTIELNVFYYAITGAIISYYFANTENGLLRFALLLPMLMSAMLAGLFFYGSILNRVSREEMFQIRDALELRVAPDFVILSWFLRISAVLMAIVSLGLLGIVCGWFG